MAIPIDDENWDDFIDDSLEKQKAKEVADAIANPPPPVDPYKKFREKGSGKHLDNRRLPYVPGKQPLTEAILDNGHAVLALELLKQGRFNYQIAAQFGVCTKTLWNWKESHPDLKVAWALGEDACHAFWTDRLMEIGLSGEDKGSQYKAVCAILNNRFPYAWGMGTNTGGANSVQNINIQQLNVAQNLNTKELLSTINAKIDKFKDLKVLDAEFKPATLDEDSKPNGE